MKIRPLKFVVSLTVGTKVRDFIYFMHQVGETSFRVCLAMLI